MISNRWAPIIAVAGWTIAVDAEAYECVNVNGACGCLYAGGSSDSFYLVSGSFTTGQATAIVAAASAWNAGPTAVMPGASWQFNRVTPDVASWSTTNNRSDIAMQSNTWFSNQGFPDGQLGMTSIRVTMPGCSRVEWDIAFNGGKSWTTGLPSAASATDFSLAQVAEHQFGHAFGLLHEEDFVTLMNGTYPHGGNIGEDLYHRVSEDEYVAVKAAKPLTHTGTNFALSRFKAGSSGAREVWTTSSSVGDDGARDWTTCPGTCITANAPNDVLAITHSTSTNYGVDIEWSLSPDPDCADSDDNILVGSDSVTMSVGSPLSVNPDSLCLPTSVPLDTTYRLCAEINPSHSPIETNYDDNVVMSERSFVVPADEDCPRWDSDVVVAATAADTAYVKQVENSGGTPKPCTAGKRFPTDYSTLQLLVDSLQAGQVGCIDSGTHIVNGLRINGGQFNNGTSASPIYLRPTNFSAPPVLQRGVPGTTKEDAATLTIMPATQAGVAYWVIDSLTFDHGFTTGGDVVRIEGTDTRKVHHVAIRDSSMFGTDGRASNLTAHGILVYGNVEDLYLNANDVHDIFGDAAFGEVSGITIMGDDALTSGPERILIRNSTIMNVEFDGIHCSGALDTYDTQMVNATDPVNIILEDNQIDMEVDTDGDQDQATEHGIDLKSCRNVIIRGVPLTEYGSDGLPGIDNSFIANAKLFPGAGASGEAIDIIRFSHHVLIENTRFANNCVGVGINESQETRQPHDIVIRRNAFYDFRASSSCGGGDAPGGAVQMQMVTDVDIYHNTMVVGAGGSGLRACPGTSYSCQRVDFWDNIVTGGLYYVMTAAESDRAFHSGSNLYFGTLSATQEPFYLENKDKYLTFADWQNSDASPGPDFGQPDDNDAPNNSMSTVDPQFSLSDPNDHFCVESTSAQNAANLEQDDSSAPVCSLGADLGWMESDCADCPNPAYAVEDNRCDDYTGSGCAACTARPGCGWCAASSTCMPGEPVGPNWDTYSCGVWDWRTGEC